MDDHHCPGSHPDNRRSELWRRSALALVSASSFGLSGSLARSLLDLGWSPTAVVATRVGGAFHPSSTISLLRRIGLPTGRQSVRMLAYGVARSPRPALLLQRGAVPLGRCRLTAGVPGAGHTDRLALGANPAPPRAARACGRRIVDRWPGLRPRPADWAHTQSSRCGLGSGCCPVSARTSCSARTRDPMHQSTRCC